MTRPSKKLDSKQTGPYTVSNVINKNAYKLDLPYTIWKHNVFHVSLLDCYTPPTAGQALSEPLPTVIEASGEWEVDRILDSKRRYRKLRYLVQWAGYSYVRTSWEQAENLGNAQELVDEFHRGHPRKPRGWLDLEEWDWTFSMGFYFSYGSRAGINGVGTGFYHLPLEVEFPRAPNPPWGCS